VALRNRIIRLARRGTAPALAAGLVLLVAICCATPLNASPQLVPLETSRRTGFARDSLPLGRHIYRAASSLSNDGVWSDAGVSAAVTVMSTFWTAWWSRGIAVLLILGVAMAIYWLRIRAIEARSHALARQVAQRTRELAAVNAIAAVVSRSLNLDQLLADALEKTLQLMNCEAGGIYLLDPNAGVLTIAAHQGLSAWLVEEIDRLEVGEGFSGRVVASGEPLVVPDVSEDVRLTRMVVAQEGFRSFAIVPIGARGRITGTLFMSTRHLREFSRREVQLLASIGDQIGVAVQNARLFAGEQRRAEQFRVLSEVGRRTTSILSTDELLHEMVALIREGFGYDVVEIGLVEGEELVFRAGVGRETNGDGHQPFQTYRIDVGRGGIAGEVAATGIPILIPDVNRNRSFAGSRNTATCSELAVPIKSKDEVIGVLNVRCVVFDAFDESDLAVLQALADQAGTAIANAQLFEAEQRRAEQFRVISEVGSHITSILAVDELLNQIVRLIQQTFGYYHVGIGLVEDDEVAYRVGAGEFWETAEFQFEPARLAVGREGITGWVAATGEPLLVPDVSEDPRYVSMSPAATRSELTVPLKVKGDVIGVLDVQSDQLNAFDESDLLVLQSLAHQAAIAIENARLYEQARRLAVIEERQRLARELHDSVTQALYGVSLYAEAAARRLDSGMADAAKAYMHDVRDTAREALREMRLLIFELRPSVLQNEGLLVALRARLEAVEERAGIGVNFQVEGEGEICPMIEEGLYRIAREVLNNALKHAAAQNIDVNLTIGQDVVVLEIVDDGVGFNADAAKESGGLGLEGMVERATQIGGELVLDSEPGHGTRVRVEVVR